MKAGFVKRTVVVLLVICTVALNGCNRDADENITTEAVEATDDYGVQDIYDDAEAERDKWGYRDELYYNPDYDLLTWAFVDTDISIRNSISNAFNEALIEEGYDFQVEFVMCPVDEGEIAFDTFMEQTSGDVDLLTIRNNSNPCPREGSYPIESNLYEFPITDFVENDMLLPLDEYVDDELSGMVADEIDWTCCTYNGVIYGVPASPYEVPCRAYQISKELFDKSGLTFKALAKELGELDAELETLYYLNDNQPVLQYDELAAVSAEIMVDYDMVSEIIGIKDGVAVNIFEQEDMRSTLEALYRYNIKGYISDRVGLSGIQPEFSYSNGKVTEYTSINGDYTKEYYLIPYGEIRSDRYSDRFSTGISVCANSDKVDKALEFIKAIETNETLGKILNYGIEGLDYEVEDGVIYKKEESDFYGNINIYGQQASGQPAVTGWVELALETEVDKEKYTSDDIVTSNFFGEISAYKDVTIDLSQYSDKLSQMQILYDTFSRTYSLDKAPAEQLHLFNKQLGEVGIDEVIEYINNCLAEVN